MRSTQDHGRSGTSSARTCDTLGARCRPRQSAPRGEGPGTVRRGPSPSTSSPPSTRCSPSAQKTLDAIAAAPSPRTYASTLEALDLATNELDYATNLASHLEAVLGSPELRDAFAAVVPKVTAFYSQILLSEPLYRALRDLDATDEAKHLDPARRRYLTKTLADFRRNGAELDADGQEAPRRDRRRALRAHAEVRAERRRRDRRLRAARRRRRRAAPRRASPRARSRRRRRAPRRRARRAIASRSRRRRTARCMTFVRRSRAPRDALPRARHARVGQGPGGPSATTAASSRTSSRSVRRRRRSSASRTSPISRSTIAWRRPARTRSRSSRCSATGSAPASSARTRELAAFAQGARSRGTARAVGHRVLGRDAAPRALRLRRGDASPVFPARSRHARPLRGRHEPLRRHHRARRRARASGTTTSPRGRVIDKGGQAPRRLLSRSLPARDEARRRVDGRRRRSPPRHEARARERRRHRRRT